MYTFTHEHISCGRSGLLRTFQKQPHARKIRVATRREKELIAFVVTCAPLTYARLALVYEEVARKINVWDAITAFRVGHSLPAHKDAMIIVTSAIKRANLKRAKHHLPALTDADNLMGLML
jgi:hypothetical protein